MNNLAGERTVRAWNEVIAPGTRVIVIKDNGDEVKTKTRSEAWLVGGHTPVVLLDGISGGYDLSRVRPDREESNG